MGQYSSYIHPTAGNKNGANSIHNVIQGYTAPSLQTGCSIRHRQGDTQLGNFCTHSHCSSARQFFVTFDCFIPRQPPPSLRPAAPKPVRGHSNFSNIVCIALLPLQFFAAVDINVTLLGHG